MPFLSHLSKHLLLTSLNATGPTPQGVVSSHLELVQQHVVQLLSKLSFVAVVNSQRMALLHHSAERSLITRPSRVFYYLSPAVYTKPPFSPSLLTFFAIICVLRLSLVPPLSPLLGTPS